MSESDKSKKGVIAVNRFGLGAKPGELETAKENPVLWLKNTLTPVKFDETLPTSNSVISTSAIFSKQKKMAKKNPEMSMKKNENSPRVIGKSFIIDGLKQSIKSTNSISWRLLDFFSNHFSVSMAGQLMSGLAPTLEREAIAPNMLGNFEDMLIAVVKHPAMLIYLNNEKSFGPNSLLGKRRKKGMNENLAREILELHTLGVDGGYSQSDVIELAKGITGWTFNNNKRKKGNIGFNYNAKAHEPGVRNFLGEKYAQKDITQGEQMLKDIAKHPNTAKYLCFKIAQHFISDTPSKELLNKLESVWLKSNGNIKAVMFALIEHDDAWASTDKKLKTPREFVVSTLRALNITQIKPNHLLYSLVALGQKPFAAGSPAGYSADKSGWDGANALMARIDWANSIAPMSKVNAERVLKNSFANHISQQTYQIITRAESRKQALTLLLMSPEFQRR